MIIDKLENAKKYYVLGENIKKGFEFLKNENLVDTECKKHIISGEDIWANIQDLELKEADKAPWEVHRKYTDIQFVISGIERMDWANLESFSPNDDFDFEKDIQFGKLNDEKAASSLVVKQGYFVIFTPDDLHKPGLKTCGNNKVKKVIVKVNNS